MTLEGFKQQFVNAKDPMPLNDAANYIRRLCRNDFPMLPKTGWINDKEYQRRIAQRTACTGIVQALISAPPWKDYREIIAELEWPYMRRVTAHCMEDWYYDRREGEADVWFLDHWFGFHDVFMKMPGSIPNTREWIMYDMVRVKTEKELNKFRRSY